MYKLRKIVPVLLYASSIVGVVIGFLLIQTFGQKLVAPIANQSAVFGRAATQAHATDLLHVLLALVTVVAMARVVGMLFSAIQQPPVIGEIIAGIMLGPSLLGRIATPVSAYLFPATVVPALNVISQVSVILFMFLVGLELNLGLLRKRGHATVAISHASILAPFFLGALLSLLLYPRLSSRDVPFTNFALFLGVSMSVTAFPVLARILTDRRMNRTRIGAIALTCAAVDDLTAWCLLALVVGVARAESAGFIKTILLALIYVGVMAAAVRPALGRLALVYGNKGRLTQGLMATIFVLLLLSASATEMIGIHAIFGAFALGAMIPHDSGMARELTDKLEDLVVVMLLPAFFAFTGLRTQIGLVSGGEQWALCGLIIGVASVGKFGGSLLAARITGLDWRDGSVLGVLMNTRGLMELIVLNIGYEMHIISPTLFAMMVLMALVTTLATTPILHLIIREKEESLEAPRPVRFERDDEPTGFLVPVANPNSVARLVGFALTATPAGVAPPRVVALVRRPAVGVRTGLGDADERSAPRSAALGAALELAWGRGAVITPQAVWSDDPAADLVKIAMEANVGWILLGPHRAVFGADFHGGVVSAVLDRARALPLNVAVAIQAGEGSFDQLFAIVDATPDGRAALELATRMAQGRKESVHAFRIVGSNEPIEREFSSALGEAAQRIGRDLHIETVKDPTTALIIERTAAGMVIIGANVAERLGLARRGFAGFPDSHPMVLVQGSRFARLRSAASVKDERAVAS
jgi:Kef-type K+ transport system membrane component KefB